MFIATRASGAGIVFLLLTAWISGPSSAVPIGDPDEGAPAVAHPSAVNHAVNRDVNQMQQLLLDRGDYRGKVDGVLGLRTRSGIRAYQKAEHLPVTGQLDPTTADKLGILAENSQHAFSAIRPQKPSAGIR